MAGTVTVRLAQRGGLTLPKELRRRYNLRSGDTLSLFDLGGVFVLSAQRSEVDALADELTKVLIGRGETLESVLAELRAEREHRVRQG